jgi:hypothetical protein
LGAPELIAMAASFLAFRRFVKDLTSLLRPTKDAGSDSG